MTCSVYIAMSLDGFIARPDGGNDWLHRPEYANTPFNGIQYVDFIRTIDTIVMGRKSFEKVVSFNPWPYEGTPVVVLTDTGTHVPQHLHAHVRTMSGAPRQIVTRLYAEGLEHLYIDGGVTIQRFLADGLVGDLTVTIIPILLGEGIPLFSPEGPETSLTLLGAEKSDNGFVQVRYRI